MVQKIQDGYKPHTNLRKDKEQIKRQWKEHFEKILNKNKHKNKTAALDIEQNQMNTESGNGNTGTNEARNPAGHTEVKQ